MSSEGLIRAKLQGHPATWSRTDCQFFILSVTHTFNLDKIKTVVLNKDWAWDIQSASTWVEAKVIALRAVNVDVKGSPQDKIIVWQRFQELTFKLFNIDSCNLNLKKILYFNFSLGWGWHLTMCAARNTSLDQLFSFISTGSPVEKASEGTACKLCTNGWMSGQTPCPHQCSGNGCFKMARNQNRTVTHILEWKGLVPHAWGLHLVREQKFGCRQTESGH